MTIQEIYQKIFPNETEPWNYNNFNVYFKRVFTPLKQKLKYSIENEFNITLKDMKIFVIYTALHRTVIQIKSFGKNTKLFIRIT